MHPQGAQDDDDVDAFLEDCAVDGRDVAESGDAHGGDAEADAGYNVLFGDFEGAARDFECDADAFDFVDGDDDIGAFR